MILEMEEITEEMQRFTKDNFRVVHIKGGYVVRWLHNNEAIHSFTDSRGLEHSEKRAKRLLALLVKYCNLEPIELIGKGSKAKFVLVK